MIQAKTTKLLVLKIVQLKIKHKKQNYHKLQKLLKMQALLKKTMIIMTKS